jgi:hypothetical protein
MEYPTNLSTAEFSGLVQRREDKHAELMRVQSELDELDQQIRDAISGDD